MGLRAAEVLAASGQPKLQPVQFHSGNKEVVEPYG